MKTPTLPTPNILATIKAKDLDGKVIETYEIVERTFFAATLKKDSAVRKRIAKDFIHSNQLQEYKIALRIKSTGGSLCYKTKEEAISAANNLAGIKQPNTKYLPKNVVEQLNKM